MAMAAIGLAVLTQVGTSDGLVPLVTASVIISLGLAPVLTLTTELIVGSAPPERAGAASGISETGAELGGALGISIMGSIGVAVYRGALATGLPAAVPADSAAIARDTLGGALAVAQELPQELGAAVREVAQDAFVAGMHLTSAITTVIAVAVAALAVVLLRSQEAAGAHAEPEPSVEDAREGAST